eukprot:TRINITY_DN109560_c0_g1_i1.p1 TRINITY_DN109560_c0_g1~~TRINITY_DN109560_c0_g1_i1.p1  ORF type:complete len:174 (+),score=27.00 TRINITY_DN109560_c0_g1_i1:53-574(+)
MAICRMFLLLSVVPVLAHGSSDLSSTACNDADHAIWEKEKGTMNAWMKTCILKGAPGVNWTQHCINSFGHRENPNGGSKCMANCVHLREQFSISCSKCFGDMSQCTYDNCAMKCLNPVAKMCTDCIEKYKCQITFSACSGFTDLPPAAVGTATAIFAAEGSATGEDAGEVIQV